MRNRSTPADEIDGSDNGRTQGSESDGEGGGSHGEAEEYDDAMICSNDVIRRWAANINCGRDVAFSDEGVVGYSIQKSSERSDPTAQRVERGTRVFDNRQKDG